MVSVAESFEEIAARHIMTVARDVVSDASTKLLDDFQSDRHGDRYAMNDPRVRRT